MKRILGLLLLAGVGMAGAPPKPSEAMTYYVQIVQGTDEAKPRDPKWKPIGPKLSERLATVFRWNHYWEVSCQPVSVARAKPAKIRVTPEREVEILLLNDKESEVRLYRNGRPARKSRQSIRDKMTIMGWDKEKAEAWFVVVRTEKPQ